MICACTRVARGCIAIHADCRTIESIVICIVRRLFRSQMSHTIVLSLFGIVAGDFKGTQGLGVILKRDEIAK